MVLAASNVGTCSGIREMTEDTISNLKKGISNVHNEKKGMSKPAGEYKLCQRKRFELLDSCCFRSHYGVDWPEPCTGVRALASRDLKLLTHQDNMETDQELSLSF